VVASEVIEHIPDYEMALSEAARVCRNQFAITVPDMACLPYGHAKRCIPWHLLEATHVNFFNHRSLKKMLAPHFRSIQLFQIAGGEIEGTFMPGSLGAIATK
jgi:ubiquinone/menaquinone biosynthesis C-methylase UbiE